MTKTVSLQGHITGETPKSYHVELTTGASTYIPKSMIVDRNHIGPPNEYVFVVSHWWAQTVGLVSPEQTDKRHSIYLAGPLGTIDDPHLPGADWRVQHMQRWNHSLPYGPQGYDAAYLHDCKGPGWPRRKNAVFGSITYTGPYFENAGHGQTTQEGGHGLLYPSDRNREHQDHAALLLNIKKAIGHADLVVAFLDRDDPYGTIAEVGYAAGKKKPVYTVFPFDYDHQLVQECWLAATMSNAWCCWPGCSGDQAIWWSLQQFGAVTADTPMPVSSLSGVS